MLPVWPTCSAKQYAANKAVEWLIANQLMPDDGVNVTFKKPKECPPTPSSANAAAVATPPMPGSASPPAAAAKAPQTPKSRGGDRDRSSGSGDKSPDDSDDDNVIIQVEKMCRSFGYGTPRYIVTAAENSVNMFNGTVDWGDEWRVPASVGVVTSIYGRKYVLPTPRISPDYLELPCVEISVFCLANKVECIGPREI